MSFSVEGTRVTVAGAARSGLAAAELLARRGARVTLSDSRAELSEAGHLRSLGVTLELGGKSAIVVFALPRRPSFAVMVNVRLPFRSGNPTLTPCTLLVPSS